MPDMIPGSGRRRTQCSLWPLEELVRAQRMACDGHSVDTIAQTLGRSGKEVRRRLYAEPAPGRQELANVGYPHLKEQRSVIRDQ